MEQAKRVLLTDGTVVEADPNRPYTRFLKITTGPVTIRLSLTAAEALHEMLGGYFTQPDVVAAMAGETR